MKDLAIKQIIRSKEKNFMLQLQLNQLQNQQARDEKTNKVLKNQYIWLIFLIYTI